MTTGERIKRLRKNLGLSADELGKMIGKDRSTIYRYECGEIGKAPIYVLPSLAKALQTTPQHLMGWDDKPALYWVNQSHYEKLSERAEEWFNLTGGHRWTDKEMGIFGAQAQYFLRIKGTDEHDTMLQFLATFYRQLNKAPL